MARNKQNFIKYWPVMLLAAAAAEWTHAPWMPAAMASTKTDATVEPAGAAVDSQSEVKTKTKSDIGISPTTAQSDPSEMEKKLEELSPPADPWLTLDFDPPLVQPVMDATTISLLHTSQLDNASALDGLDLPSSGGGSGNNAVDPIPPTTQLKAFGGDEIDSGPGPTVTPGLVPVNHQVTLTEQTGVPEPGLAPVVLGGLALLGRRGNGRKGELQTSN